MSLVTVTNLSKTYRLPATNETVRAVDNVSLSVDSGEILGVVGESGCGKTTLGRCIVRLLEPSSGKVEFKGQNVATLKASEMQAMRRKMQIVFQDPYASLDPRWRIYEILEEPLRIHNIVPRGERKSEVARLLSDVGLPADAAYRYPHEFSGGQRQRIGIARALALRPEFLIADEPVSALDVSIRAQILNLLLNLQQSRGIAIVFIGHDLGVVRQISQRIAVMRRGAIVEKAEADALFEQPAHPYTRTLLTSIPSITNVGKERPQTATIATDLAEQQGSAAGCSYRSRCTYAREICKTETPSLSPVGADELHLSACHFRNDLPVFQHQESEIAA